jgi:hypothetical protein
LIGIKSNPSLNGAVGTVVGDIDSESRGKYCVRLDSPAAAVADHPSPSLDVPISFFWGIILSL